jgi:site-specific recombinase XerC
MKRPAIPALSEEGQQALDVYTAALREHTDTSPATVRNYRSDLRQLIAWCERTWATGVVPVHFNEDRSGAE